MRRALALITCGLVGALLTGCGSGTDDAQRIALAALATPPPTSASTSSSSPEPKCGKVTASLRPPATEPAPGAVPPGSYMARIRRRGYLIAGVDQNTLLFAYFNPRDRQLEGFEIDMLREVARAIFGNPNAVRFKAITTAERVPAVQDGSVDIVADAMTITCERRRQVDFSTVYYDAGQRLLVPLDSRIRGASDLRRVRVCATIGSTSLQRLESLEPRPIAVRVPQRTDCLVALQEGQADAVTSDDAILLGFKAQDPYTKIVGRRFADEPYGMAISKSHPDFVRYVNGVLAKLRADGTWRAIYAKWLGRLTPVPAPPAAQYTG
jgi:polar amino acid transport system substrate-binding protein